MPLFLTSQSFAGLGEWLRSHGAAGPVVTIVNASRGLKDGAAMVDGAAADIEAERFSPIQLDVLADGSSDLDDAAAIVLTGGDPFRLLADLRVSGAGPVLAEAHARGVPIAGQSAGAIVCGPTLEPIRLTSPFDPPIGLDLRGLGLWDSLILPHHDRPRRAELHRQAARSFGETVPLFALWDDEVLQVHGGEWLLRQGERATRIATAADSEAVAALFHEAARAAWAPFLGAERLDGADLEPDAWAQRIAAGGHRFLITEDAYGLLGFAAYRRAPDDAADRPAGELDLLYTHPRAWGTGVGRRLLARATWNLLCEGFREAVLWTEARNERALAMYRRAGWMPDGAVDEREYLGAPIRNLRHRLELTRYAGGV